MKKLILFGAAISISVAVSAQHVALKNNLLYDATTTPNLALEVGLGKKTTLDLYGGYNPFTFGNHKRFKHWLCQPVLETLVISSTGWHSRNSVTGPVSVSMEPSGGYICMEVSLAWPVSVYLSKYSLLLKTIAMKDTSMEEVSVWDINGC